MAWFDWNQTDLPCQFSVERTQENRTYLQRLLELGDAGAKGTSANSLLTTWNTTGAIAFLEMNWLAEDLRLLEDKSGFRPLLRDLCDDQLFLSTRHMLHSAALFERARPGAVLEFVIAGDDEAPDFVADISGDRVPVEAKLLMLSDDEQRFVSVAKQVVQALLIDRQVTPPQTAFYLIFKQPVKSDVSKEAIAFCCEVTGRYGHSAVCERGTVCNVFWVFVEVSG